MIKCSMEKQKEVTMSRKRAVDWSEGLREEVAALRTLRDELRVRIHLGTMDAKDQWQEAERTWRKLEGRLEDLGHATVESAEDVGAAVRLLASTLRDAYVHIKAAAV